MTVPDFVVHISEWLLGLGVGAAAIAWLVRALFQQLLAKDIEVFKADLQRSAVEHQARFSKLHERRVDAIDGLYRRLVQAQNAFMALGVGILKKDETYDDGLNVAGEAGQELVKFFGENRLYFDEAIIRGFGAIDKVLSSAWYTFVYERRGEDDYPIPPGERGSFIAAWRAARDGVNKQVPHLLDELEGEMRDILGASRRSILGPRRKDR